MESRARITRYAWLSIGTAVFVIVLKVAAYLLTGSIGFLSDALESGANLVTAVITLVALLIAAKPPDDEHPYGHSKAEYLSAGAEGTIILIAAAVIIMQAVARLISPEPLSQVPLGLLISAVAAAANFLVARVLLNAGRVHRSDSLTANAHHLLTDVWTSAGVIVAVGLVGVTGWLWLDPLIAIAVAVQIIFTGVRLVRSAVNGLMDAALPDEEVAEVRAILDRHTPEGVSYHALRTRRAGAQRFVSVHIQVPGRWSVKRGHELLEDIERDVRDALAPVNVITHLEPVEDPVSWEDAPLNRED